MWRHVKRMQAEEQGAADESAQGIWDVIVEDLGDLVTQHVTQDASNTAVIAPMSTETTGGIPATTASEVPEIAKRPSPAASAISMIQSTS